MRHPIPKELTGEERILELPWLGLYLNKTGIIYNGSVTVISAVLGLYVIKNVIVLALLLVITNVAVYPLAQKNRKKSEFDGGNVRLDKWIKKKHAYKKKQNMYLRRLGNR